jgi:hypothetical protein
MATNNRIQGSGNQSFKQIEGESWLSTYLPAISAGTVMAIVLFLAISCSRQSGNSTGKISPPAVPAASTTAATTTASATAEPPKKIKKHRPANATYVNGTYGVSFSYPRKYSLQAGDGKSSLPVPANFVKPGAVEIATVDLPDSSFADTDFTAGLLNVTVNPGMTSDECAQFVPSSKDPEAAKPENVKIGSNDFTVLEQMNGESTHQADVKYFHLFKNDACYEFALDVETSRKPDEELAQVDRGKVFQQLAKILTTARIKEVEMPGIEKVETSAATQTAVAGSDSLNAEKAQVVAPQQK